CKEESMRGLPRPRIVISGRTRAEDFAMPSRSLALLLTATAGLHRPLAFAAEPPPAGPANRLAKETSPYLLPHARGRVDWYPWGEEAFAKAKKEGKLISLSSGFD